MNIKNFLSCITIGLCLASFSVPLSGCAQRPDKKSAENAISTDSGKMRGEKRRGGPQLGQPGGGPVIDKTGKSMMYNLYSPRDIEAGKTYPLVLFMADASTPGTDVTRPLTQGYGALVWATEKWQAEHPCYILVPQYSGVAVNDAYEHTDEIDMVARLVQKVASQYQVDTNRLYTTGQSMGGMISMYYNSAYPDLFAASIFVDCHWDSATFPELVKHKFVFITAGKAGTFDALEKAAQNAGIKYEYTDFSAKLPQSEQDSLAREVLAKGAPITIINFTSKSVLPADGKGSEHMYSFDYAYRLTPVREWLFMQRK